MKKDMGTSIKKKAEDNKLMKRVKSMKKDNPVKKDSPIKQVKGTGGSIRTKLLLGFLVPCILIIISGTLSYQLAEHAVLQADRIVFLI